MQYCDADLGLCFAIELEVVILRIDWLWIKTSAFHPHANSTFRLNNIFYWHEADLHPIMPIPTKLNTYKDFGSPVIYQNFS